MNLLLARKFLEKDLYLINRKDQKKPTKKKLYNENGIIKQQKINKKENKMAEIKLTDQEKQFMIGLTALTHKTGVIISGCGCCGSPDIHDASKEELADLRAGYAYTEKVSWISPEDDYDWEHYFESIVK